jgi:phosphatidylethanolamine-binding protein (PEBP) family uncharacterized protein
MKHIRTSIACMAIFLVLALLLAASPLAAQAHPLNTQDQGGAAGRTSGRTSASIQPHSAAPASPQEQGPLPPPSMTISQTLSDEAQRNTIAFDGLAFLTGSLGADSFFPPGKVADFWGFQYLRDNDPSQMGHNPLFLTSASFNMWNILTLAQRQQLKDLANAQVSQIDEYANKRFVLMKAFRRQLEGNIPTGSAGLDLDAVKAFSAELYRLDGQMSYDRAQVMGGILASLSPTQTTFLNTNMVGKGMLEWPAVTDPSDMDGLSKPVKEALMTYAGDMYSWYAGSVEADVYFCPERQGTYFGSFYLKDTPVMSAGGTIDANLTATAGITFLLTLTPTQASLVTDLVDIQRTDLYEIVDRRTDISTLLRGFIAGQAVSSTQVLDLAGRYGELDGEIVYHIATNFATLNQTLTDAQQTELDALRQKLLGEFPLIPDPYAYRYSDRIDMPAIPDTDFLFLPGTSATIKTYLPLVNRGQATLDFTLTSPEVVEGGTLPADYTCDGSNSTLPLAWSSAPEGTASYAVVMHHVDPEGLVKVYWVLYDIPADITSLAKNTSGIGTLGLNTLNDQQAYAAPCSQGPGDKTYTYTVYALSAEPQFSVPASQVTREVLLAAMQGITLDSAELNVIYSRP